MRSGRRGRHRGPTLRSALHRQRRRGGFAILMVVLVLVGLAIIGAPFAISMRQEENASINFAARVRARLAARGALHLARARLEQSHESNEQIAVENDEATTIYNSPYVDASGELRVILSEPETPGDPLAELAQPDPTGVMCGIETHDEQGKLNVVSASRAALTNLLLGLFDEVLDPDNPGSTRAEAVAAAIVAYRSTHEMTSVSHLRQAVDDLTEGEFRLIARHVTVHSAPLVDRPEPGTPLLHPVNLNTCSIEVLRALLRGIQLHEPDLDDEDKHKGVGYDELTVDDGEGNVETWTDDLDELIAHLRVFARLAGDVDTGSTVVELASADAGVDTRTFLPEPKQSESGTDDVDGYWISIEGDAVRYWKRESGTLNVSSDAAYLPAAAVSRARSFDEDVPVEVRLLLTDLEHDLAGILDHLVDDKKLTPKSRAAILANAINPLNAAALETDTTTCPFCFQSFNIYTIEATGIVNAPDGREIARYTIQQVAQVTPQVDLEVRLDSQESFERFLQAGVARHVATWPNPTQVSDVAGKENEVDSPVAQRGRVGLAPVGRPKVASPHYPPRFAAYFDGPLLREALAGDENSPTREPHALTSAQAATAAENDDLHPEGLQLGEVPTGATTTRLNDLVYVARGANAAEDNVPQREDGTLEPFTLEMWIKFNSPGTDPGQFDYEKDQFLFDLAKDTFRNRVALLYDARDSDSGDLVVHVCDSTREEIAAQVRYPITVDTFQPQRWYHLAAVVKGTRHNELALFVNGRCVALGGVCAGQHIPGGVVGGDTGVDDVATDIPCSDLRANDGPGAFASFSWPGEGSVIVNGEIVEYAAASSTQLSGCTRGARRTLPRAHLPGTAIEMFGYDVRLRSSDDQTAYPAMASPTADPPPPLHMLMAGEQPTLAGPLLPDTMPTAEVDDGDDQPPPTLPDPDPNDANPAPTLPNPSTTTSGTDYWDQWSTCYSVADLAASTDHGIPTGDWLPVCASAPWAVPAPDPVEHTEDFDDVVDDLASLLLWTTKRPTQTVCRVSEDDGIGFLVVDTNPSGTPGEIIKFASAGIVLVYRDMTDSDGAQWHVAWYIGYIAGFDVTGAAGQLSGRRACFSTTLNPVYEGATLRLDCMKVALPVGVPDVVADNWLARGLRHARNTVPPSNYNGLGTFQIYANPDYYEWVQYTYPQLEQPTAPVDERALLAGNQFLVGIERHEGGTVARLFDSSVGAFGIMPVFFGSGSIPLAGASSIPVHVGAGEQVTLSDATGEFELHVISHADGDRFAFRDLVGKFFAYGASPRLLKFPSGTLPIRPDTLFYVGGDAQCHDGAESPPFHEGGAATGEPERPANVMVDDVVIRRAPCQPARLWDVQDASGGPPTNRDRVFSAITAGLPVPFCIRVGRLEGVVPDPNAFDPPLPPRDPFCFLVSGQVGGWPLDGYLKINDECLFYRTLYRRRGGNHSARLKILGSPNASGLVDVYPGTGTPELCLELTGDTPEDRAAQAERFPRAGYITLGAGSPKPQDWLDLQVLATSLGVTAQYLYEVEYNTNGNALNGPNGRLSFNGSIGNPERLFYNGTRYDAGNECLWLTVTHRELLDSPANAVAVVDPERLPTWYLPWGSAAERKALAEQESSAGVSVITVELLVLERGCLGTEPGNHEIGSVVTPMEHIPTTLAPRTMVRLRRGADGRLPLDGSGHIVTAESDPNFDLNEPWYEYGIVVEDNDDFPAEGYVQVGHEIIGYSQDRRGDAVVWEATVPVWDEEAEVMVDRVVPVLTGIKHLRQRFGSGRDPGGGQPRERETWLEPGGAGQITADVDPLCPTPNYWTHTSSHIVRLVPARYEDRYPKDPTTHEYTPHSADGPVGYYEFACTVPGALWTHVAWLEAKWDAGQITNDPGDALDDDDPWDIQVLAQIGNTPAWGDTATDPDDATRRIASPIRWDAVATTPGLRDELDPYSFKKPIIYLFDDPAENNYINPIDATHRGQHGDRISLRVYFKYRDYDAAQGAPPDYNILWRTPWVDWIRIGYRAPTRVLEHREMPY